MIKMDVRIEEKSLEGLQELVNRGEFTNVAEAIRYCIRKQLIEFKEKGRSPPPLRMTCDVMCVWGGGNIFEFPPEQLLI